MAGEASRLTRRGLGVRLEEPKKDGTGGLVYPFEPNVAALWVRYHRTAARVLWDLYSSTDDRLEPLYESLREAIVADDRPWAFDGAKLSVQAFRVQAFKAGERQVVGTVKNAILEAWAERGVNMSVDPERPDIVVSVREYSERLVISLDLAGRPLHQRGYRQSSGVAPMREDLAAQLVMLARHDSRTEPLIDPMAGSGTLGIEAASLGQGRYLWQSGRSPLMSRLPLFESHFQDKARPLFGDTTPMILMNEIDPDVAAQAERNADTAGVKSSISVRTGDFRSWQLDAVDAALYERGWDGVSTGLIISNPPYGERLEDARRARQLYSDLGRWCRLFPGYRAAFLVTHGDFEDSFGARARVKKPLFNGPLRATFFLFDIE
jgi:23S rRNA G2445 N2-methylase RlmL